MSESRNLKIGDKVRALKTLTRRDGGSIMPIGETGVVTSVWNDERSQIVGVRPDDPRQGIMVDIVCFFNAPPVFEVVQKPLPQHSHLTIQLEGRCPHCKKLFAMYSQQPVKDVPLSRETTGGQASVVVDGQDNR